MKKKIDWRYWISEIGFNLVVVVLMFMFYILLFTLLSHQEQKVMEIKYCFQELADGSLYHYVCEK